MNNLLHIISKLILLKRKLSVFTRRRVFCTAFASCGKNVSFCPDDSFSYNSIHIGNDVFIGKGAVFSSITKITIEDKVMFGPNVTIMGGDHNTTVIGRYMFDVKEKLPENDQPVLIEKDSWIGANATILKGVIIRKGSVVAAGAVVTKSTSPYSIVAGIPARIVGYRFSEEQIAKHELSLAEYTK